MMNFPSYSEDLVSQIGEAHVSPKLDHGPNPFANE